MPKTILIAEKPDQARSFYIPLLERISGEKFFRANGYYESDSYYVTWFFGHLLEQIPPDEYDPRYKTWNLTDLPIIPEKMLYKYKTGAAAQGAIIIRLIEKSDTVICGTDPDREGQGIFDSFIKFNKINKKMMRLWATSLTDKDLLKAWGKIKSYDEYANLSLARELRADSDWLVGMNSTRAYSVISKNKMPVGRVLTATLALIVKRDRDVESYRESFYYQLKGFWNGIKFTYYQDDLCKFDTDTLLNNLLDVIKNNFFSLKDFKQEQKTSNPPKPFTLPDLQKVANKKYGFPLDKTLKIAQELYELKLTTYPRTDSPYLPESDLAEYHELVRSIASPEQTVLLKDRTEKPACVKNTESPHTALIVTGEKPYNLTDDQSKLYNLIKDRFIVSFMKPHLFFEYTLQIADDEAHLFKATVRSDISKGFKTLIQASETDDDSGKEEIAEIPAINEEDLRNVREKLEKTDIEKIKKTKPQYFTPATLITAMQTCGRSLDSEKYRKILFEVKGIGTPATQALFPEHLKKYEYITDTNGRYISTPKGRGLIDNISPSLTSPELTAEWELKLKLIESGDLKGDEYKKELHHYVRNLIVDAKGKDGRVTINSGKGTLLICPKCGKNIIDSAKMYSCEDRACSFFINKSISGKAISSSVVKELVTAKITSVISGFKKKDGSGVFSAKLTLNENFEVKFSFDKSLDVPCPKCSKTLELFQMGIRCTDRDICKFVLWDTVAQKKLTQTQLLQIVSKKKTKQLSGFKKRTGDTFSASLFLKENFTVGME